MASNISPLPSCRFIPYCSSDVWSGTGPAPTLPSRPRQDKEKERETNTTASRFFWIPQIWASVHCKKILTHLSLLLGVSNQFDVCICYQLRTPSWDPWSSGRSSKTSSPRESSRPRLSCCLAQGRYVLLFSLWWWPQLLDKSLHPLYHLDHLHLSTLNKISLTLSAFSCQQQIWSNVNKDIMSEGPSSIMEGIPHRLTTYSRCWDIPEPEKDRPLSAMLLKSLFSAISWHVMPLW